MKWCLRCSEDPSCPHGADGKSSAPMGELHPSQTTTAGQLGSPGLSDRHWPLKCLPLNFTSAFRCGSLGAESCPASSWNPFTRDRRNHHLYHCNKAGRTSKATSFREPHFMSGAVHCSVSNFVKGKCILGETQGKGGVMMLPHLQQQNCFKKPCSQLV